MKKKKEKNLFSKLAYKIITPKNHVMDGYQKGHTAIQAGGLKKSK